LAKSLIKVNYFSEVGNAYAHLLTATKSELEANLDNWGSFVAFPNIQLLWFVRDLIAGKCFGKSIPITKLGKIATIGIDWKQFNSSFRASDNNVTGSYPIIYGGEEKQKMHMFGEFNKFIIPKDEKAEKLFHTKASYLLVPDRIWIVTSHTISIFMPSKVLSNVLYAIKLKKR
jgi:hypothetical protein